jgi:uncharacterized protein (TIGR01777 family)
MNILITGGTGLIGRALVAKLQEKHEVTVLTRHPVNTQKNGRSKAAYINELDSISDIGEFQAIINLAGEPIAEKRWTSKQKQEICDSRWAITSSLVAKINSSKRPPEVFLSGSAIGFYGRKGAEEVTEDTPPHDEFTHQLCKKWETIAFTAQSNVTRVCTLRTGVVLAARGGALEKMALPFKLGLGGKLGNGEQYLSWIHISDMVNAIIFALETPACKGPINMTAPSPVTNREFSLTLAKTLSRPCVFTVPEFAMKMLMGESADMILNGQKVIPAKLTAAGFQFSFPTLEAALDDIYH